MARGAFIITVYSKEKKMLKKQNSEESMYVYLLGPGAGACNSRAHPPRRRRHT
jgi:hypothetical protein